MKNKTEKLPSAVKFARRLFFVPKCAACRERLKLIIYNTKENKGQLCFCKKCLAEFEIIRTEMCHTCGNPAGDCTCMPKKNTFAQPNIPSLFFYHPNSKSAAAGAIYTLKRKNRAELFDFLTDELLPKIQELLSELEIAKEECIVTYIPRTEKAITKHGFDQGKILAKELSKKLGAGEALPLLTRKGSREQKKLAKNERDRNISTSLFANTSLKGINTDFKTDGFSFKELISGKIIILIDDVITTGASAERGIKILKQQGARAVLVAAAARGEISRGKKK